MANRENKPYPKHKRIALLTLSCGRWVFCLLSIHRQQHGERRRYASNTINILTKKTTQSKSNPIPVNGPGKFQWNAGGWFGASLGSSAWMLVTSCFLVAHNQPLVATIAASGFLAIFFASLVLWRRRDRVHPFHALMAIPGLMAFTLPIVWLFVPTYASAESKNAINWRFPICRLYS